jgi:hypothetical protein
LLAAELEAATGLNTLHVQPRESRSPRCSPSVVVGSIALRGVVWLAAGRVILTSLAVSSIREI